MYAGKLIAVITINYNYLDCYTKNNKRVNSIKKNLVKKLIHSQ